MFTGIIEYIGAIKKIEAKKNLMVLSIDTGPLAKKVRLGDSVSVSGVCLTVTSKKARVVNFDLMKETIEKTSLRSLGIGDKVNLELALQAGSRLGGHFVTGHVDEVAVIKHIAQEKNWVALRLGTSQRNRKYFVRRRKEKRHHFFDMLIQCFGFISCINIFIIKIKHICQYATKHGCNTIGLH